MNWIAELCDLYDKNQHLAGRMGEDHIVLLPPYHTTGPGLRVIFTQINPRWDH